MQVPVTYGPVTFGAPAEPSVPRPPRRRSIRASLSVEQAAEMFARRLKLTREERIFYIRACPRQVYTPEILQGFVLRRWSSICPDCGLAEAGSLYCSRCFLPMVPSDWFDRRSKPMPPMSATYRAQLLRSYQQPPEDGAPVISGDLADDLGDDGHDDVEDDED